MPDESLYRLILEAARAAGDRPVLIEDGKTTLRYDALDAAVAPYAGLLADMGATPGERIVVQIAKSRAAVLLYLAALRAGVIFVPLNTAYTPAEIDYFLRDAAPRLLVCDPASAAALAQVAEAAGVPHVLTLDELGMGSLADAIRDSAAAAPPPVARHGDDLAAILYTSGTTGRSKGAMLSHRNLSSNAITLRVLWAWRADDVLLHALPIYHVHGLFVGLHGALLAGATMLFHARFDAAAVLRDLPAATVMMGVPTFYTRLLDESGFDRGTCRAMRLFISGSAPLLEATFAAFEARTGHRILERYGMTEAGMITSNPYDGERIAGTVGYALPGVSARVCDDDGRPVPAGEPGVLEIAGANLFRGYWRQPGKTAEDMRGDGFFVTGDVATIAPDGRVRIVGRAKDLIIAGGFNVYPKEIELLLDTIPGIGESAVIGVPHPDLGEAVVAVVTRDGAGGLDEAAVLAALDGKLARFKQPRRIVIVDALSRNAMGKVQKAALRAEHAGLFA